MSSIGHPDPPSGSRFMPKCSTCKDSTIDPLTEEGRLAKQLDHGSYQCLRCQQHEIENIQMRLDPHSDRTKQILYKRIREMEEGKLKQDEIRHLRSLLPKMKIVVKRKFPKQKPQQPPTQKEQPIKKKV
jgi:hypothetical protein